MQSNKQKDPFEMMPFFIGNIIGWVMIILCAWTSCTTPSITIYQRGESIGNGEIKVTETLNLNVKETIYKGKADSGQKVIVTRKLK